MVFKRPYAFLIKYFKLINLILSVSLMYIIYKLNNLHTILNQIYRGSISNFSSLSSTYIGFTLYLLIFATILILVIMILLLKRKKKPMRDYVLGVIYCAIIIIYLFFVDNLFYQAGRSIVELTTLKLYSDISFIIVIPIFYFLLKYFVMGIGFNLKKFDFGKDILELKQEEQDNEEVEINFDKNTYKYKRKARKILREFKYYTLENKLIIRIIIIILGIALASFLLTLNIVFNKTYKIGQNFVAGQFGITINSVYETKYDLNNKEVRDDSKYVIANIKITNQGETKSFDFNTLRILFKDDYVYANNYFNEHFVDLGIPYDGQAIKQGETKNYIFIFKVPEDYYSKKYVIKFYDKNEYNDKQKRVISVYKTIKVKAVNLDKKRATKNKKLNETEILDKGSYGDSKITIKNYEFKSSYTYTHQVCDDNGVCSNRTDLIKSPNNNKVLLILDYELLLDKNYQISSYFKDDKVFFNNFLKVRYTYNGKKKILNVVDAIASNINNKVFLSVPYEIKNADNISLSFEMRNNRIEYVLK